ncbi:MAG: hypothetical protein NXI24_19800 [bacterium]|nr:hypothetical protein [bacterium]
MSSPEQFENRLYLDDACLLLLAAAGERKQSLLQSLADHVKHEGQVFTSAAGLATVQEYFLAHSSAAALRQFWSDLDGLFREILPVRGEDLGRALDILEFTRPAGNSSDVQAGSASPDVSANSKQRSIPGRAAFAGPALHAAIALNNGIEWIADPNNRYGDIPGIKAFEF